MEHAYGGDLWPSACTLEGVCVAARPPPLLPDEVRHQLETTKKFTARADIDVVDRLYRTFFDGAIESATRLDFSGLKWGAVEIQQLCAVLPRFVSLRELDLSKNNAGQEGAKALSKWLETNASLQALNV